MRLALSYGVLGLGLMLFAIAAKAPRLGPILWAEGLRDGWIRVPVVLEFLRPEILLALAVTGFGADLWFATRRRGARALALLTGFGSVLVIGFLEWYGNAFYTASGGEAITLELLRFAALNADSMGAILGSEIRGFGPTERFFLLTTGGAAALYFLVHAWKTPPLSPRMRRALRVGWPLALGLSLLPSWHFQPGPEAQTTTYSVLTSGLWGAWLGDHASVYEADPPPRTFPADTELVPRDPTARPRDLVVIFLESVRSRSLTPYDPAMKTSPFLAELAKEARVYERAYVTLPHTSKAISSTLCGIEPFLGIEMSESDPARGAPGRCLPALLKDHGYQSAWFWPQTKVYEDSEPMLLGYGFDRYVSEESLDATRFAKVNYFGLEDDAVLPASGAWLADLDPDRPMFAAFMSLVTHHDYGLPPDFPKETFVEDPADKAAEDYDKYLNGIRYSDRWVGKIFDQLKAHGRFENSLFLIVGDHGESFGEHGRRWHSAVIYNESIQIPAILYDPRRPVAARVEAPVSNVDFLPTLVDELGYDLRGEGYDGFAHGARPADAPIFSHCYRVRSCAAVIRSDLKLLHFFGFKPDELYDVRADPFEQTDLAADRPRRVQAMRRELLRWRARSFRSYREFFAARAAAGEAAGGGVVAVEASAEETAAGQAAAEGTTAGRSPVIGSP